MPGLKWLVIGTFVAVSLIIILSQSTGPFFDEGIYVASGLRTLDGHGFGDGYMVWFAGTLLWPFFAGLGYSALGLIGVRLLALIFVAIAYVSTVQACESLYGEKAGVFSAIALGLNGPMLSLSHLGVYDVPAVAGVAICFWATVKFTESQNRKWLPIMVVSWAFAFLSKYPSGLMILPISLLVINKRGEKAVVDLGIFGFLAGALLLCFLLPVRGQVGQWLSWSSANKPVFGATRETIAFMAIYFGVVPFILALLGWFQEKNKAATILLVSLFIWPAYHLVSGNPVGDQKHYVMGFLFAAPLIGRFLSAVWQRHLVFKPLVVALIAGVGVWGNTQMNLIDHWWPDGRPVANFLMQNVKEGEKVLANNMWVNVMYLYGNGNIPEPWVVYDQYRLAHFENQIPLCQFDWFVDEEGSYRWGMDVLEEVQKCGFEKVFEYRSKPIFGLTGDFRFSQTKVYTSVWHRTQ